MAFLSGLYGTISQFLDSQSTLKQLAAGLSISEPMLFGALFGKQGTANTPNTTTTASETAPSASAVASDDVVPAEKYIRWGGRILIIGAGSIGMGTLPLVLKHIDIDPKRITVLTAPDRRAQAEELAARYGVSAVIQALTPANYATVLAGLVSRGDFIINVSVDVSSCAVIEYCSENGILYLDTVVEPWAGGYTDPKLSPSLRSNYAQREEVLALRKRLPADSPTAVVAHGANPGMVNHLMKQALLNIAKDTGVELEAVPKTREEWGRLAQRLNIKAVHISERDTQVSRIAKKPDEFVNTWSIDGFVSEGCQPAELGWGTHEKALPEDGHKHAFGSDAAIYLDRPGAATRVRSWAPNAGPFHGFLITHNEAISIADYFTLRDASGNVTYRPTCHYSYHPCNDAVLSLHEFAGRGFVQQSSQRLLGADDITHGADELGVLLMGHEKGAYWYGSQLDVARARKLADYNSATTLQVTSTILAGVIWAIENPALGVVEPEEMDYKRVLDVAMPYILPVVGKYTEWTPVQNRGTLFPEDVDREDPWQFKNFRVL